MVARPFGRYEGRSGGILDRAVGRAEAIEQGRTFRGLRDAARSLYAAKIEIMKRSTSPRERLAAIRALQAEQRAALCALAHRRAIERLALRERRQGEQRAAGGSIRGQRSETCPSSGPTG